MITPTDFKSSGLIAGFDDKLRVARVSLAEPGQYRERISDEEWQYACTLDGKRRIEHVAGRVAARAALHALVGSSAPDLGVVIARAEDGAPEISGMAGPPLVSISHGHNAAVAAVGYVGCLGIDLCDHEDALRVRRVALRFMRPEETALAHRGGAARWASLWALKEAGAKALHHGLLEGGLRATSLASIEPAVFRWPSFVVSVIPSARDVVAVVYQP
jgi:4'-phosphopantetheinyl transferase EntD